MPLSISRGKFYEYLGMTFDFTTKDNVMAAMYDQVDNIIDKTPPIHKLEAGCATPSPSNLYNTREPCEENDLLLDTEREKYQTLTARCLYVPKCDRSDLHISIVLWHKSVYTHTK